MLMTNRIHQIAPRWLLLSIVRVRVVWLVYAHYWYRINEKNDTWTWKLKVTLLTNKSMTTVIVLLCLCFWSHPCSILNLVLPLIVLNPSNFQAATTSLYKSTTNKNNSFYISKEYLRFTFADNFVAFRCLPS